MNRLLIISILSAALMTSCGHSGPDGQGELPRGRSARPRNRASRSRIGRARSCQRESHGPRPRGKGARSCRRNRVYERTGRAYRFRAADRRARPVPRRDRDKRPDSGSARRRGRRSGAVSGIVSFADQETLGRSGRIPGRDPFSPSRRRKSPKAITSQRIRSAYTQAETAFRRAEKLIGDRIITQTEYEQARLAYENAKTAYDALASKSSAKGTRATAPIAASSRACRSAKETTSR